MSRNKENIPLTQRAHGSHLDSSQPDLSGEFFTDSVLDIHATPTSKIPSPSAQKAIQARSRRVRQSTQAPVLKHRASAPDHNLPRSYGRSLQPATPSHRDKSLDSLHKNTLATPPQSRDGPSRSSPEYNIKSPPPREFSDVYQQIADEEDLAATEREPSDDEDYSESPLEDGHNGYVKQDLGVQLQQNSESPSQGQHSSRIATPTQEFDKADHINALAETVSDPTGMSFVNGLTDQGLKATLTPHFSESARDRAKLREVWDNQRPVAFTKATKTQLNTSPHTSGSNGSGPKLVAFTKAARRRPNGFSSTGSHSDSLERPGSQRSDTSNENRRVVNDIWHDEERPLKPLPINPRIDRGLNFTRAHGFPNHRAALTEQNLEQQNRAGRTDHSTNSAPSSLEGPAVQQSIIPSQSHDQHVRPESEYLNPKQNLRNSNLGFQNPKQPDESQIPESSKIDWRTAAAEVPLPSVEDGSSLLDKSSETQSPDKYPSPGKSRRWENDFTGQSFQVSESPPVRLKSNTLDNTLHEEIQNLSKKGLATSRIGEIRDKHSRERLYSTTPLSSRLSGTDPREAESPSIASVKKASSLNGGEAIPDTPVVIFRSSSNSTNDLNLNDHNKDRDSSHDFMQRFARAVSGTPKSSPPSMGPEVDKRSKSVSSTLNQVDEDQIQVKDTTSAPNFSAKEQSVNLPVAQTPRVVGAWMDTVLPDTIKTVRQTEQPTKYAQTPHVSAGGWIDTPIAAEPKKTSKEMTPIVEEIPEELVDGFVKDHATSNSVNLEISEGIKKRWSEGQPISALAGLLNREKQKPLAQRSSRAPREDTLNLGNETVESLEGLLAFDEDELTILSRLSATEGDIDIDEAMAARLKRMAPRLNRVLSDLHDANKGISKILPSFSSTICEGCQAGPTSSMITQSNISDVNPSSFFPRAKMNLSLPIPLLFYPRTTKSNYWFPKPTPLGWITLSIWLWYLLETTMCEIYCRPLYAEHYDWPELPEPEFPYVIPTMLYRWAKLEYVGLILSYLIQPIFRLFIACWRILAMSLGLTDGFVDSSVNDYNLDIVGTTTKRVLKTMTTAISNDKAGTGSVIGIMDDEYL